jgi:hypothetical protein
MEYVLINEDKIDSNSRWLVFVFAFRKPDCPNSNSPLMQMRRDLFQRCMIHSVLMRRPNKHKEIKTLDTNVNQSIYL